MKIAPVRFAAVRFALERRAPVRSAPGRSALRRTARVRSAPVRSTPGRYAQARRASWRNAPPRRPRLGQVRRRAPHRTSRGSSLINLRQPGTCDALTVHITGAAPSSSSPGSGCHGTLALRASRLLTRSTRVTSQATRRRHSPRVPPSRQLPAGVPIPLRGGGVAGQGANIPGMYLDRPPDGVDGDRRERAGHVEPDVSVRAGCFRGDRGQRLCG